MLLLRHLKSYLPAHSILRGFVALRLCDFADAVRAGCAEAKLPFCARMNMDYDAIRAGCAEAKICTIRFYFNHTDAIRAGCSETNGRSLYSNDHTQNNEVNRKESYPIQP